jgi:hypothetical protein
MSGKIKIGGLALAAALAVLWAWSAYGEKPIQNPCGSQAVGVGLKAWFLSEYVDLAVDKDDPYYPYPRTWDTFIQPDVAGLPYQFPEDCVYLYDRDGGVKVNVDRPKVRRSPDDERYLRMRFMRKTASTCYPTPDFLDWPEVHTSSFEFRSVAEFLPTRGYGGDPDVLCLQNLGTKLDFRYMKLDQIYYCTYLISFLVGHDPDSYRLSGMCKVIYRQLDSGNFGWEITPVHEPFWIPNAVPIIYDENSVNTVSLVSSDCWDFPGWGHFYTPFKLVLERL